MATTHTDTADQARPVVLMIEGFPVFMAMGELRWDTEDPYLARIFRARNAQDDMLDQCMAWSDMVVAKQSL